MGEGALLLYSVHMWVENTNTPSITRKGKEEGLGKWLYFLMMSLTSIHSAMSELSEDIRTLTVTVLVSFNLLCTDSCTIVWLCLYMWNIRPKDFFIFFAFLSFFTCQELNPNQPACFMHICMPHASRDLLNTFCLNNKTKKKQNNWMMMVLIKNICCFLVYFWAALSVLYFDFSFYFDGYCTAIKPKHIEL